MMTLRDFFDSFTASPTAGLFPVVLPSQATAEGSIDIRIENPFGVPSRYAVGRQRGSDRLVTIVDVSEGRVGIPNQLTMQLPIDDTSGQADHLITIRAGGRTSKLVLYRESLGRGEDPQVGVAIAATGAVQFSVRRPARRSGTE